MFSLKNRGFQISEKRWLSSFHLAFVDTRLGNVKEHSIQEDEEYLERNSSKITNCLKVNEKHIYNLLSCEVAM